MTRQQNMIAICLVVRTIGKNTADCCQLDTDSLHHVASLSLILAVTAATAAAAASPSQGL